MSMTKIDIVCEAKNKTCSCYFSCQYIKHRFGVIECCHKHKKVVNEDHKQELEERTELLRRNAAYGK